MLGVLSPLAEVYVWYMLCGVLFQFLAEYLIVLSDTTLLLNLLSHFTTVFLFHFIFSKLGVTTS